MKLENKIMIVTGGGSGIGRTIAVESAKQGAKVVIVGRKEVPLQETAAMHDNISYVVGDVSRTEDVTKTIEFVKSTFGRLDVLVNNAGIAPVASVEEQTLEGFDQVFNINVRAALDMVKQSLPMLRESKGNVINISSGLATNPQPYNSVYAASKATINSLTVCWAKEFAPHGIRVNAVGAGATVTPLYDKLNLSGDALVEYEREVSKHIPLGRFGNTHEIANVVLFLASDEAAYVTGSIYGVDGGFGI